MTLAGNCCLRLTGEPLQFPMPPALQSLQSDFQSAKTFCHHPWKCAPDFRLGCRDVTQEVRTPIAWVKDLQISFTDAGDRQTQV